MKTTNKYMQNARLPRTRGSYAFLGLMVLAVSYFLWVSAVDTGSYWFYLGWLATLMVGLRLFKRVINFKHGQKS